MSKSICGWKNQFDWFLVMKKQLPLWSHRISAWDSRNVDRQFLLSYVIRFIYTMHIFLHMCSVHKVKGLQHSRHLVLQVPLCLQFLAVTNNKNDIASTHSFCFWKMYPVQSRKRWRSLQKNRVVGGWHFVTCLLEFSAETVAAVDITRRQDFDLQELNRPGHDLHWLIDWLIACNSKPKESKGFFLQRCSSPPARWGFLDF